ncbi:MAG: hypothetical protein HWQ38_22205 [Nostoc sp. NMS7]|uniref:hypothetical protein n=1 Tax=Nostoc sp. NMS7 TaxID=2815391 RepID=UPI0025DA1EEC|nr:hypothetical protein [Nostoc sp. NMS7]MBN3949028.1 hypothetical protein [Nostoc sp. NMS7]
MGHGALVLTCTERHRSSVAVGVASRREVLVINYSPLPLCSAASSLSSSSPMPNPQCPMPNPDYVPEYSKPPTISQLSRPKG